MLDFLTHPDKISTALEWQWAFAHPILHTLIKLGTPTAWAIIIFTGFRITRKVFQK